MVISHVKTYGSRALQTLRTCGQVGEGVSLSFAAVVGCSCTSPDRLGIFASFVFPIYKVGRLYQDAE